MIIPSARRVRADMSSFAEFARIPDAPVGVGVYLWPLGGRIYVGHGEWTDNLGPTDVVSLGPAGDVVRHLADVPTDALDCYRMIEGAIYAPYTDPRGPDRGGYVTNAGGEWHTVEFTSTPMVHCFDMGATSHGLWMTGSAHREEGTVPVVLLSTDGGVTWTEKYTGPRGQQNRFYGLWIEGDAVFVREPNGAVMSSSDGGEVWTQVDRPDLHAPLSFSGYTAPDYARNPNPTVEEQRRLDWSDAVERPDGSGRHPVFMDDFAYVGGSDGAAGIIIYRRPTYLDRPQNN